MAGFKEIVKELAEVECQIPKLLQEVTGRATNLECGGMPPLWIGASCRPKMASADMSAHSKWGYVGDQPFNVAIM